MVRLRNILCSMILGLAVTGLARADNALRELQLQPATGMPVEFYSEIDILFVYDRGLLNRLPFTQFDWISGRENYLNVEQMDLRQIQLSGESLLQNVELPERSSEAIGILVFASHADPVAEAVDITDDSRILLQIDTYGINVLPVPAP